jgi:hypothetical protein
MHSSMIVILYSVWQQTILLQENVNGNKMIIVTIYNFTYPENSP